jgi:hypothetical protein
VAAAAVVVDGVAVELETEAPVVGIMAMLPAAKRAKNGGTGEG